MIDMVRNNLDMTNDALDKAAKVLADFLCNMETADREREYRELLRVLGHIRQAEGYVRMIHYSRNKNS